MSVGSYFNVAAQVQKNCTCPTLGELLPDYIVELLEESASLEVEDHLLDCLSCREKYLKMLCLNGMRRRVNSERDSENRKARTGALALNSAKVISLSDYKKQRS